MLEENAPDRVKYAPFYDDNLEEDFQKETAFYIKYLFTDNRKISELVESDYHFINDKLAVLYGIENVKHNDIRKVDAGDRNDRMGILSHAGFMAATYGRLTGKTGVALVHFVMKRQIAGSRRVHQRPSPVPSAPSTGRAAVVSHREVAS